MRKKCSSDRENLLKFETEGQEFAKILRSLEQYVQTVKGQNRMLFQLVPEGFSYLINQNNENSNIRIWKHAGNVRKYM